jgi:hypothetical protein
LQIDDAMQPDDAPISGIGAILDLMIPAGLKLRPGEVADTLAIQWVNQRRPKLQPFAGQPTLDRIAENLFGLWADEDVPKFFGESFPDNRVQAMD